MSNLGLAIIYDVLNRQEGVLAERVFAPWVDMEAVMRENAVPLFSLESRHDLKDFDVIGFSVGYELTYTNLLNMLDMAGIPLGSNERGESMPLVIAGGTCALNPEPIAEFVDLFVVGEGEEVVAELVALIRSWKKDGSGKKNDLLRAAAGIAGIYVPSFYRVSYDPDGTVSSIEPTVPEAASAIERQVVAALPPTVTRPVVPFLQAVHDRGAVEIQRGCHQGCRFCQAGMIYRPVRARARGEVIDAVEGLTRHCGYEEVSLLSLSTTDYPDIADLVGALQRKSRGENLTLSLPSLRLDTFSAALADSYGKGKKAGFTFAPEAGSERLRRAINKAISAFGDGRRRRGHSAPGAQDQKNRRRPNQRQGQRLDICPESAHPFSMGRPGVAGRARREAGHAPGRPETGRCASVVAVTGRQHAGGCAVAR
jgi:radical SAM superfamily enzyme YgiQ (UPF0313 family)